MLGWLFWRDYQRKKILPLHAVWNKRPTFFTHNQQFSFLRLAYLQITKFFTGFEHIFHQDEVKKILKVFLATGKNTLFIELHNYLMNNFVYM